MTIEELNYIKDAFSQIIEDIAGNPDWYEAARAVASDLGTLERELGKKVASLPSNLDEAARKYGFEEYRRRCEGGEYGTSEDAFKAGAEWMAGQGWHDITETPSIFGFYLVIHEKGWCVANYMGKGVVCESGCVEALHNIEIEHPQKWLDLRDLIPKKQ